MPPHEKVVACNLRLNRKYLQLQKGEFAWKDSFGRLEVLFDPSCQVWLYKFILEKWSGGGNNRGGDTTLLGEKSHCKLRQGQPPAQKKLSLWIVTEISWPISKDPGPNCVERTRGSGSGCSQIIVSPFKKMSETVTPTVNKKKPCVSFPDGVHPKRWDEETKSKTF